MALSSRRRHPMTGFGLGLEQGFADAGFRVRNAGTTTRITPFAKTEQHWDEKKKQIIRTVHHAGVCHTMFLSYIFQ
jgi:hypothetical protein